MSALLPRWLARSALTRFTLLFAFIFALGSATAFYLAYSAVSQYTASRIRDTMDTDREGLRQVLATSGVDGLVRAITQRSQDPANPRVYLLVSPQGERMAGNFDAFPNNLSPLQSDISFENPNGRYDGTAATLPGDYRLLIAHARAEHEALLAGLRRDLLVPALLALLLAVAAGFFVSRRLLQRIEAVNATCRAVESGNVAARVSGSEKPDEFGELAANINAMLARIAVLMAAVHDLSNHIAHEMRTPLARLRSRLERDRRHVQAATGEGSIADLATRGFDAAIDESQKIIDMFSALLDIAAAESAAGDKTGLVPVDLGQTLAETLDIYEIVAEERHITLTLQTQPVPVLGEPVLLLRMLANVVDNALKFAPQGGRVTISLSRLGSDFRLEIADNGKGMPADFIDSAFERFARAADSGAPGHGLGLPLVRAIALRHGMKITLEDNAPGLRVVFRGQALSV